MKFFFRFLIGIGLKLLIILHFDFLCEPHSAVPLYADECGSLGFVAFSTVSGVSKKYFFDTLTAALFGVLLNLFIPLSPRANRVCRCRKQINLCHPEKQSDEESLRTPIKILRCTQDDRSFKFFRVCILFIATTFADARK